MTGNAALIEATTKRQGLNLDFVKAVFWLESTHATIEPFLPKTLGKSPLPLNVTTNTWGKELGISKDELADLVINIEVGTFILGEIWKRTVESTPEKVGTLWQDLSAFGISDIGKTIDHYFRTKPWMKK